jgi:16S rRNA A1518/A1519 N6-dimethyltransferase RsmA/KsgA/DIM1 with predicted DNA glycosylase/AP lyase activity
VVTKAFSQRRKVIRKCVAGLFTEDELRQAGVDPQPPGSSAGAVRGPGQPAGARQA